MSSQHESCYQAPEHFPFATKKLLICVYLLYDDRNGVKSAKEEQKQQRDIAMGSFRTDEKLTEVLLRLVERERESIEKSLD